MAREFRTPTFLWPHKAVNFGDLRAAVVGIDLAQAVASRAADELAIRDYVDGEVGGGQTLSKVLRAYLVDRVECFEGAFKQAMSLDDFRPDRLRLFQAESERRAELGAICRDSVESMKLMQAEADGLRATLQAEVLARQQSATEVRNSSRGLQKLCRTLRRNSESSN